MNRRQLLRTSALAACAATLAACDAFTTTTDPTTGVKTLSVNVAKLDAYGQAFINGASLLLSLPGISTLPAAAAITAILLVLKADLATFDASAAGNVTLSFDASSVPAAIQSVLTDGKTLLTDARNVVGTAEAAAISTAQIYVDAISTVVALFAAEIGQMTVGAAAGSVPMTESRALAVLGVR
jgi:hypothetical protein